MTEKKIRQRHLWEVGRDPPDISPYERKLMKKLKPKVRRDQQ